WSWPRIASQCWPTSPGWCPRTRRPRCVRRSIGRGGRHDRACAQPRWPLTGPQLLVHPLRELFLVVDPLLVECLGGEAVQRAVWPVGVVLDAPVFGQDLRLQERVELLAGQELVADPTVERLANPVLPRRSRVDERRVDPGEPAPVSQGVGGQFWPVVHADVLRAPTQAGDQVVENGDGGIGGERAGGPGGQGFAGELVDDIQQPHLPAVDGDVDLEVQRPHLIDTLGTHPLVASWAAPLRLGHPGRTLGCFLNPLYAGGRV